MIADRKVFIKVPKRSQAQVCKTEKSLSNWVGAVDVIHKLNLSSQAHELPVNTFLHGCTRHSKDQFQKRPENP